MAVSVRSLPRSNDIPQVVCSHNLVQAENNEEDREEEAKMGVAGSLSGPLDLRRSLVRAKLVGSEQLPDCPGRLFKSDSMDSMLGDSLLDPPQSLSKMAPKRYQSPSRCGSPSMEAPDHLLAGRWEPPPTYEQTLARMEEHHPADLRLNRHDIMRRRDMNLFLGLHPRLLTGPPRFSLPPKSSQTTRPSPAIPCRAMACQPAVRNPVAATTPQEEPVSDRLPEHCQISGKHNCEFEELDDGGCHRPLDLSSESSGSPTGENYQQAELGAKHKGWTSRPGRTASTPYSGRVGTQRDNSSDGSDNDPRLKATKTVPSLPLDSSDALTHFRSRVSPVFCQDNKISPISCKEARRPSPNDDCLNDLIFASRRSSIDELLEPHGLKVEPQRITQVWRAELPQTPSPRQFRKIQQEPSWVSSKRSYSSFKEPQERCSSDDEEEEEESKADILLGAILKHSRPNAFDAPYIHSEKETNVYYSPPSPLTPDIYQPAPFASSLDLVDLCAELETKCLISKQQSAENDGKENDQNCYNSPARTRSYSEACSPFSFTFGSGIPTLDALDMSFDDFDDHLSFSTESVDSTTLRARSEKRRNSVEDEGVPSANKKAAFRKSFDSATSMVFHSRNGLPLTSSPAPMRRGIKFDFDEGITTPKDIKRALFESQQDRSPKKKKRDPRKLLSTSAPASVTGNNLLCNFEESVLNGRLEPVSTVEGFTAEIGASGSFHPKHSTFPVTVFFYTLCENSNIASPYLVSGGRHYDYIFFTHKKNISFAKKDFP